MNWQKIIQPPAPAFISRYLGTLASCLIAPCIALGAVSVQDDAGKAVVLPSPARRIVTLAPHAAEMVYALGGGGAMVGTVRSSDYPPEATKLPVVGDYTRIDVEAIASLRPDLVIAWGEGTAPRTLERLHGLGIVVFVSMPRKIADIPADMKKLSVLLGLPTAGDIAAADFDQRLRHTAKQPSKRPLRAMYQVWGKPMIVMGRGMVSEAMERCGALNVFADASQPAPVVDVEAVLAAKTEVIIAGGRGGSPPSWLADWKAWPAIPAVAQGQIFTMNADLLQRPGPRFAEGVAALCSLLAQVGKPLSQ